MGSHWSWVRRFRCDTVASWRVSPSTVVVMACRRWRWHRGPCRGEVM